MTGAAQVVGWRTRTKAQVRLFGRAYALGLADMVEYRGNVFVWAVSAGMGLLVSYVLWRSIYAGRGPDAQLEGYTFTAIITYYLVASLLFQITGTWRMFSEVSREIREGQIQRYIAKPFSFVGFRLALHLATQTAYLGMVVVPLVVTALVVRIGLLPPAGWSAILHFVPSVLLAIMLQFFIGLSLALLTFWFHETMFFHMIVGLILSVASGEMVPLDFFPALLRRVLLFTPLPCINFVPVRLYFGRPLAEYEAIWAGHGGLVALGMQLFWTIIGALVARVLWRRGLRVFSAFGG